MSPTADPRAVASRITLAFVAAGAGVAAAIAIALGEPSVLLLPEAWLGQGAAALAAWWSARRLAGWFGAAGRVEGLVIGALQALLCLGFGALVGSLPGFLVHGSGPWGQRAFDWLGKPCYWVLLFGGIPAVAFGAACALLLRRRLRAPAAAGERLRA